MSSPRGSQHDFGLSFEAHLGPLGGILGEAFWEPKWNQNRSKIEVENEDEKKTLLGAPWIDFGSFWEATWGEKSSKFIGGASI